MCVYRSVMDGMTEACVKGGIEACYSSVSCACALLVALDELAHGHGIQPEQVRINLPGDTKHSLWTDVEAPYSLNHIYHDVL